MRQAGVPVVLDAVGSALWHGISRRPALVMDNSARQITSVTV
jgi:hypothetical protein